MTTPALVALVLWAVVVGLDLASVFQGMLSRPLVAGTVAGLLVGDVEVGLRVGVVLELFALDVVPVGAARYPDFGAATVAAVAAAAHLPWLSSLGGAAGLGLLLGVGAGYTIPVTRRLTARAVAAAADRLASGDPTAVQRLHWIGFGYDLARSTFVALVALGGGLAARRVLPFDSQLGVMALITVVSGGLWAVMHGAISSARHGIRWRWLAAGLALGAGLGVLR